MIFQKEFSTRTSGRFEPVDVTDDVVAALEASGVTEGSVLVFCPHTTCSVLLAAPGPDVVEALRETMEAVAPEDGYYHHDDLSIRTENLVTREPANAPAHILNAVIGKTSESIPVTSGRLMLGRDQRVLFMELDSARRRTYCIQVIGE